MSDFKAFFSKLWFFLAPGSGFFLTSDLLALTSVNNRHMTNANFASLRLKVKHLGQFI